MKKTFLTLLLLVIANFSIAQDASNDATWEETIEFISEQKEFIQKGWNWHPIKPDKERIEKFIIEGEIFTIQFEAYCEVIVDLSKLYSANILTEYETTIELKFTGNYSKDFCEDVRNFNEFYIGVSDIEIRPRLLKAFQHLAYLATNKRQKEIKKSSNKF